MASVKEQIARLDAKPVKERALLFLATLAVLLFLWDSIAMQPVHARQRSVMQDIDQKRASIEVLKAEAKAIEERGRRDPDAETKAAIAAARGQIDEARRVIAENQSQLVPPEQIAEVLKSVLARFERLNFVALTGLGSRPVQPGQPAGGPAGETKAEGGVERQSKTAAAVPVRAMAGAWLHGIRLEFSGSYFDMVDYLKALEALSWKFLWEGVSYTVTEYPGGKGTITVNTMSLAPDWIQL
jgi:MSHA biogenesis protein MshJ